MTHRVYIPFLIALLFWLSGVFAWAMAEDAHVPMDGMRITSQDQFRYARSLSQSKKWETAIHEYERFLHFYERHHLAEAARFYLAEALLEAGQPEQTVTLLEAFLQRYPHSSLRDRALVTLARAYEKDKQPDQALVYYRLAAQTAPSDRLKDQAHLYLGRLELHRGNLARAKSHLTSVSTARQMQSGIPEMLDIIDGFDDLPRKDPRTAGVLALIPGLGLAYGENYRQALIAFVINASLVAVAIEAFDNDQPVLGGVVSALEIGVYSGNVFSAVNNAHRFNRRHRKNQYQRLFQKLDLQLSLSNKGNRIRALMALTF